MSLTCDVFWTEQKIIISTAVETVALRSIPFFGTTRVLCVFCSARPVWITGYDLQKHSILFLSPFQLYF